MASTIHKPRGSSTDDVGAAPLRGPLVSIVITTRNRKIELQRAVESCLAQSGDHFDVWVFDDASTDGTVQDLHARYPDVRVVSCGECRGLVVRRNQALHTVSGQYIISLDDDAYFTGKRTVSRVIELFEEFPGAAVIALPFTEPSRSPVQAMKTAPALGAQLRSFVGCAHAMRRDEALRVGGYRELLVHQGEERDLSMRLLDHGFEIVSGDTPLIVHCPSPRRDLGRIDFYGYRNTLLIQWLNCPRRDLPRRMAGATVRLLQHQFNWRRLPRRLFALCAGWCGCLKYMRLRNPVSQSAYQQFCSLPHHGPVDSRIPLAPCTRDLTSETSPSRKTDTTGSTRSTSDGSDSATHSTHAVSP